jgi:hypothetical protein
MEKRIIQKSLVGMPLIVVAFYLLWRSEHGPLFLSIF